MQMFSFGQCFNVNVCSPLERFLERPQTSGMVFPCYLSRIIAYLMRLGLLSTFCMCCLWFLSPGPTTQTQANGSAGRAVAVENRSDEGHPSAAPVAGVAPVSAPGGNTTTNSTDAPPVPRPRRRPPPPPPGNDSSDSKYYIFTLLYL